MSEINNNQELKTAQEKKTASEVRCDRLGFVFHLDRNSYPGQCGLGNWSYWCRLDYTGWAGGKRIPVRINLSQDDQCQLLKQNLMILIKW